MSSLQSIAYALLITLVSAIPSASSYAHGVKSSSAAIEALPNRLVNIKVQFNLVDFFSNSPQANALPLQVLAAMPEKMFALLYQSILDTFDTELQVTLQSQTSPKGRNAPLNPRLPSAAQAQQLLQSELAHLSRSKEAEFYYTLDDRRFYQVFNYDFRLTTEESIEGLTIAFPHKLGEVYISFNTPQMRHLEPGETWSYADRTEGT
jgi:hypothetical protein